jgi:uncharacterized membrane protein (UPF0182 family)
MLFVEPIYIEQKDANAFPQLARVLVYFGGKVGFAPTVDEALDEVFGEGSGGGTTPPEGEEPPSSSAPPSSTQPPDSGASEAVSKAALDVADALSRLDQARANNDFDAERQALADLDQAIQAYDSAKKASGGSGGNGGNGGQTSSSAPPSSGGG